MSRRFPFHRAGHGLVGALCLVLLACSGAGDATAPDPGPPGNPPGPVEPGPVEPGPVEPGPVEPGPVEPGPQQPDWQAAGSYVLTSINQSTPGQLVTLANPDGVVIGLYRFLPSTTLVLDPMGGYSLSIEYSDDKGTFILADEGEFKWSGADVGVLLSFQSATFGDAFDGAAAPDGSAAFRYDFDGDGRAETVFGFQQVTGG